MSDLSKMSTEELAGKVQWCITAVWHATPAMEHERAQALAQLAELEHRASERDQAVRERDERQERYDALYADARDLRDDNHRLRDAIEKAITGCEGEIVGEALDELTEAWRVSNV